MHVLTKNSNLEGYSGIFDTLFMELQSIIRGCNMKKKVLQVGYRSLANGGIQAVIMGIVRNLHNDIDFDVLLFSNKQGHYDDEFLKYGKIFRIPCDSKGNRLYNRIENITRPFRSFFGTYKILKNGNYSAVHCHNGIESGITLLAARIAGIPIRITHSHNTASPKKARILSKIYKGLVKTLIKRNSTVRIGCSNAANEYLYGEKDNESIVINNAIDIKKFNPSNYSNVIKDQSKIIFTHVGRYNYQKNQLFLIDVFNEIHKIFPDSRLNLIGFGEDEEIILKKIINLELTNSIKMLPHNSDLPEILNRTDYFLFPSNFEGLGISLQ